MEHAFHLLKRRLKEEQTPYHPKTNNVLLWRRRMQQFDDEGIASKGYANTSYCKYDLYSSFAFKCLQCISKIGLVPIRFEVLYLQKCGCKFVITYLMSISNEPILLTIAIISHHSITQKKLHYMAKGLWTHPFGQVMGERYYY